MSSDLFEFMEKKRETQSLHSRPLAVRMRPLSLNEWVGHENLLSPGKPLRRWIDQDRLPSLIFWGPPGCGKTSLAAVIAQRTQCYFKSLSAVMSGIKEVKDEVYHAQLELQRIQRRTILFIDEIHRFNKTQQDALLPHVEDGSVILIGATTENPAFSLNSALLSRMRVMRFEALDATSIRRTIQRALEDPQRGLGGLFQLSEEAMDWLVNSSEGDARRALTALEAIALIVSQTQKPLSVEEVKGALESGWGRHPLKYDRKGDEHYHLLSALMKSIRGSDGNAAVYYLARLLEAGEDLRVITRRLVMSASEDIGNADPQALSLAVATQQAVHTLGMPEARIPLAQVVIYLSQAPKSRQAVLAIDRALEEVRHSGALAVPLHLRNASHPLLKEMGYGMRERSMHASPEIGGEKNDLPKGLKNQQFIDEHKN